MTSKNLKPTNDEAEVYRRLESGPQLCLVLSSDIKPETLYNTVVNHYVFHFINERVKDVDETFDFDAVPDEHFESEEVICVLPDAYKPDAYGGEMTPDVEKTIEVFGREIEEALYDDDILHINGVPYMLFSVDVDSNIIDTMRNVFDIRDIEVEVFLAQRTIVVIMIGRRR